MGKELEHLLAAIDSGEHHSYPFSYIIVNDMFPEDFYWDVIRNLPTDDEYKRFKHPDIEEYGQDSPRLRLELDDAFISSSKKDNPLRRLGEILKSQELKDKIIAKFPNQLTDKEFSPKPCLMRDKEGYLIKPHPDSKSKLATFLLYFPQDNDNEDMGTIINIKEKEGFSEYNQAKYKVNSGLIFARTDESYHSVNTLKQKSFDRDLAMCLYYK